MAIFRSDGWVKSVQGQAIAGAQVYVCTQPADVTFVPPEPLASVFSDPAGLSSITQPIVTDGFGHYDFYVGFGTYTVVIVTGGKVQQVYPDQTIGFSTSGGGAVSSVFGRTGDILAQSGDYASFYDPLGAAAAAVVGLAPLNSPALTGIPTAPTAAVATNTAQIATCAFVLANAGSGAVSSVFGRVGVVTAQTGDYSVAQVTGAAPLANPSFTGTVQIVDSFITGTFKDSSGSVGTSGQLLSSTATGTSWITSSGGGGTNIYPTLTPPVSTDFTLVNPNSYTISTLDKTGRMIVTVATGSLGLALVNNTVLPATPYTIDLGYFTFSSENVDLLNIWLQDNTGAGVSFGSRIDSFGAWIMSRQAWTSVIGPGANTAFTFDGMNSSVSLTFARITDDGVNRTFWWSKNGTDYIQLAQETTGTGITPTKCGIIFYVTGGGVSQISNIYSWHVANSILPQNS